MAIYFLPVRGLEAVSTDKIDVRSSWNTEGLYILLELMLKETLLL